MWEQVDFTSDQKKKKKKTIITFDDIIDRYI